MAAFSYGLRQVSWGRDTASPLRKLSLFSGNRFWKLVRMWSCISDVIISTTLNRNSLKNEKGVEETLIFFKGSYLPIYKTKIKRKSSTPFYSVYLFSVLFHYFLRCAAFISDFCTFIFFHCLTYRRLCTWQFCT